MTMAARGDKRSKRAGSISGHPKTIPSHRSSDSHGEVPAAPMLASDWPCRATTAPFGMIH
jgi:hypothetical protein